ncbi:MAG TPA: DinB family protein [Candidatus Limnocylindrales bacterium]|nr:DinB family protein [Candidatus Limnocylindrales bacterium]
MASRAGIEALLELMEEAFRGAGIEESNESQALLTNLATVTDEQWRGRLPNVERTIESIANHVGACKIMYDDYAFGAGTLQFGTPEVEPYAGGGSREDVTAWLETAHRRLAAHVGELAEDAELDKPRLTNWGELRPTRWIVGAMITHDAYHAGEINHLRSLQDGDDRWRYIQLGFG